MREQDSTKMEFLLTLNENIVVQRFFNVRGYNPKAKSSTDLYDFILNLYYNAVITSHNPNLSQNAD